MNIYFIDYENTKLHGLYGIEKLGRFDKVIIFYSENAQSITIDCMKSIQDTKAKVTLEHAEIGRHDFLDFQLSSYLGYMARKHSRADFFIVSADKGYECLESFWKNKGVNVKLIPNIANEEEKPTTESKQTKKEKAVSSKANKAASGAKKASKKKAAAPTPPKATVKLSKKSGTLSKKSLPSATKQTKENKSEIKTETKSKTKFETESEIKPEIKPEIKSEIKSPILSNSTQETQSANKPILPVTEKQTEKLPTISVYSKLDAPAVKQKEEPIKDEKSTVSLAEIKPKNTSLATIKKETSTSLAKTDSKKTNTAVKNGSDNNTADNLVSLLGDREKAETVSKILAQTKDKAEVHNRLQQFYGAQAKKVYDKIAPLLTSKPTMPANKKATAPATYNSENYAKYYRRVLELIHNANEAKIATEIILTAKSKSKVHTSLQQSIHDSSNTRASEIYKLIKPILDEVFK